MATLRRAGVTTAIDGFGTGYSSLTYLRRLPVDVLTIDGSLVRELPDDPACRAVVSAAVQMGHALGLRVVGEGVERAPHEAALAELGADAAQGWLYSRALTVEEAGQWLPLHVAPGGGAAPGEPGADRDGAGRAAGPPVASAG